MSFTLSERLRFFCRVAAVFALIIAASPLLFLLFMDGMIATALSEYETADEPFASSFRGAAIALFLLNLGLKSLLFLAVARLLWIFGKGDVFTHSSAQAAMSVGKIQLGVACLMWLTPTLMGIIRGLGYRKLELTISMTGPIATALLFGFVLLLLATIYQSAVSAVEENRQFV